MSKKKEFIDAKMKTQAMVILPAELQDFALRAWEACKTVRKYLKRVVPLNNSNKHPETNNEFH